MFDPYTIFKNPLLGYLTNSPLEFITHLLQKKRLFCTETLKAYVYNFIGDLTFYEIFTKNGWNLNITVTDFTMASTPRLLNYLTTPSVCVWSAVCASCAIPGMFACVDLM